MPIPGKPNPPKTTNGKPTTGNGKVPISVKSKASPKLVNRGPAGLLHRKAVTGGELIPKDIPEKPRLTVATAKYQIAPELQSMVVPIDSLILDPMNARLHPEKNKAAIKQSLLQYGQVSPVVVREATRTIVAGNGRVQCMKELGWTEVAAVFVGMNEVEAAGFGVADNRTAEHAKWDWEMLAKIDQLQQEFGQPDMAGWEQHALEVLRAATWVKPEISDIVDPTGPVVIKVSQEERETIEIALTMVKEREGNHKLTDGECLVMICNEWMIPPTKEFDDAGSRRPSAEDNDPF